MNRVLIDAYWHGNHRAMRSVIRRQRGAWHWWLPWWILSAGICLIREPVMIVVVVGQLPVIGAFLVMAWADWARMANRWFTRRLGWPIDQREFTSVMQGTLAMGTIGLWGLPLVHILVLLLAPPGNTRW